MSKKPIKTIFAIHHFASNTCNQTLCFGGSVFMLTVNPSTGVKMKSLFDISLFGRSDT